MWRLRISGLFFDKQSFTRMLFESKDTSWQKILQIARWRKSRPQLGNSDLFCSLTKRIRRTDENLQKVNISFRKKDAHQCKEGASCTCAIGAITCIHFICSGLVHKKLNSKFCSLRGVKKLTLFCCCAAITCFHDMKLKILIKMNKILATIFCNIYPEHISRLFVCFIFCFYALIKPKKKLSKTIALRKMHISKFCRMQYIRV